MLPLTVDGSPASLQELHGSLSVNVTYLWEIHAEFNLLFTIYIIDQIVCRLY